MSASSDVRARIDRLEAKVAALEARLPPKHEELIWICGHRHASREEAAQCPVYKEWRVSHAAAE